MAETIGRKRTSKKRTSIRTRFIWSGTISFGLVSIPVDFLSAKRGSNLGMRLVSEEGIPLKKVYYCSKENKKLKASQIVRGYELRPNHFVVVTDEELNRLEPEKSSDINLDKFVPIDQVRPLYYENSYYLIPSQKSSAKAYHLLASVIEQKSLAGVATFVMRGKQHVVAITARNGLLQAETLRFANEIRTSSNLDLPPSDSADKQMISRVVSALKKIKKAELPSDQLQSEKLEAMKKLAKKHEKKPTKKKQTKKVNVAQEEQDEVIDIVALIAKRLEAKTKSSTSKRAKRA